MTSSLPDFFPRADYPPAADAASLAALSPANGNEAGSASGATPGFAALMGASTGPSPATPGQEPAPVPPTGVANCGNSPTRLVGNPKPAPDVSVAEVLVGQPLFAIGSKISLTVSAGELAASVAPLDETAAPTGPREITRDMLEEAASFVTSLLQVALPGVQLPQLSGVAADAEAATAPTAGNPTTDGTPDMPTAGQKPAAPAFTLAADGAIELKLDLARFRSGAHTVDQPPDESVAISAELQRPGEITVRLEAAAAGPATAANGPRAAGPDGRAIFAAKYAGVKVTVESPAQSGERNFVFTGDKQVKTQSPLAGISVAKTETIMPVAPTEEPRFTRNPETFSVLPQRAEFQVVVPPAERITVPAAAPAGQNFAERAVDTVTSLVETQFSASMQKSGSVQLHLRFGGEDLSVRVEVRDGAVHTDFHTDSPELRSALNREWQVMAAQSPEEMRRFLDPVFSSSPASADTPSAFARQQQPQQDLPSRTPRESWAESASPFSRRSQLSDSFIPEPAVARGPSFLPTSLRLSVLA